ncbi:enoyl-CoA hydratase [Sediminivirga luteola]|uniref:enoyl-CoA hydratase n=1 Tax=Sediminivirga luteola TaxID=1774748 RepID=UPI001F591CB4|nr:enoyl-CoA hydratase [Sediminivirga luteola]
MTGSANGPVSGPGAPAETGKTGDLLIERRGPVLHVTFNRPHARNAMTPGMYSGLAAALEAADEDTEVRVSVLRGAGGKAFVAGTDITRFRGFDGDDGVAYEREVGAILQRILAVRKPVVAAIDGYCIGGGLSIAACADVRIASPTASFGVPIARTLGNTLAADTLRRLVTLLGESRAAAMLLTGSTFGADEAARSGFVWQVTEDLDGAVDELAARIAGLAPLTLWSIKELLRRGAGSSPVDDDDVLRRVYGSEDFAGAVDGFLSKTPWTWLGR